jgi:hypothetical protein
VRTSSSIIGKQKAKKHCYSVVVPIKACIVFVPSGKGQHWFYPVAAESSFGAAWDALQTHEARFGKVGDSAVLHVVVNGKTPMTFDYEEHNAKQPNFRHKAGRVRAWGEMRKAG